MRRLAVIFLIALLSACSRPSLTPLLPGERILAFGDSLTEGVGVSNDHSYPAVLAALTRHEVVNAGIAGEISEEGLARLPALLDEVQPSLMVLLHGGNDILRNMNLAQTRDNLAAMIQIARARGIGIVLVGVPEKSLFSDSASIYPELAERFDLVFEDEIVADLIRSPSKKSDAVHFNRLGYSELAAAIFSKLDSAGAL